MIDINSLTLEEKILQTVVARMVKGEKVTPNVGAAFFFGEIITEANETSHDELRNYVKELNDNCKIPPLITSDFENGCGTMVKGLTQLPYLMGLGASNDEKLAYDFGKVTAIANEHIKVINVSMPHAYITSNEVDENSLEIYDQERNIFTPLKLEDIQATRQLMKDEA